MKRVLLEGVIIAALFTLAYFCPEVAAALAIALEVFNFLKEARNNKSEKAKPKPSRGSPKKNRRR